MVDTVPGHNKIGKYIFTLKGLSTRHQKPVRLAVVRARDWTKTLVTWEPTLYLPYHSQGGLQDSTCFADHNRQDIRDMLWQLLKGFKYVHARNIVHRDIKPTNVLIEALDPIHVRLSDFSMSEDCEVLNTVVGTRSYQASGMYCSNPLKAL